MQALLLLNLSMKEGNLLYIHLYFTLESCSFCCFELIFFGIDFTDSNISELENESEVAQYVFHSLRL